MDKFKEYEQSLPTIEQLDVLFNEMNNEIVHLRLELANSIGGRVHVNQETARTNERAQEYKQKYESTREVLNRYREHILCLMNVCSWEGLGIPDEVIADFQKEYDEM